MITLNKAKGENRDGRKWTHAEIVRHIELITLRIEAYEDNLKIK